MNSINRIWNFQLRRHLETFLPVAVMLCMMSGYRALAGAENMQPADLRCESLINPLGVDRLNPRLSWKLESGVRGQEQIAYRILVATSQDKLDKNTGDLWDTGKIKSDQSIYVAYDGKPLQSCMQCFWKLMAWDKNNRTSAWSKPAFWTMGILQPVLPEYRQNRPIWIWHGNESNVKFRRTLNFEKMPKQVRLLMSCDNSAVLRINDRKICRTDNWMIPAVIDLTKRLKRGSNLFEIDGVNSGGPAGLLVSIAVKEKEEDDFRFIVSDKDWQVSAGSPDTLRWTQAIELGAFGVEPWGKMFSFDPMLRHDNWTAKWITHPDPKRLSHPWLRHTFDLNEDIKRAEIHVNTGSFYELYINGKKVSPYVLSPGISQTNKRALFSAYDVTTYLAKGKNCIAFWMGPGWHQRRMGNHYNAPLLRAQLNVYSSSGLTVVGTDSSWRVKESCISQIGSWSWNNFGGEHYDAREFLPAWNEAGIDDSGWQIAREITRPNIISSWRACEGARLSKPIPAKKIHKLNNGQYVIDFGRPLTGWMRLRMHDLKAGQKISIIYADSGNIPGVSFQHFGQTDQYIAAGKDSESFCSKFNYHSFCYAVISGLGRKPALKDAEAMMVEPDIPSAGQFECSNELLNQIHEITRYTFRTQNPCLAFGTGEAREKSGYGDGGAHIPGYLYNFKVDNHFRKWLVDWADTQRIDGWVRNTAPAFEDHAGGPSWGGQASELTHRLLLYHGDKLAADQMYDALRKYVDFIESKTRNDILHPYTATSRGVRDMFLGDWIRPGKDPAKTPLFDSDPERVQFNNCYRVMLWQHLQDFAEATGRTDEYKRCKERLAVLRPLVHRTFYLPEKGIYKFNGQPFLVMALAARITPKELRPKIMAQLEHDILVKNKGHLDTGMLSTRVMIDLLTREDRNDLLSLMMNKTSYPGWGYLIKQGLKTWPESWNGGGSQVIMCTAGPGAWFFEGLGGILPDIKHPGFKHFKLKPGIVESVEWIKCSYESPYGRIISNWKLKDGLFKWNVKVPVNSTATIYLPAKTKETISEGGLPLGKAEGVEFLRMEKGKAVLKLESGAYNFVSQGVTASKIVKAPERKRVLILGDSTSMRYAPILSNIYKQVDIVRPGGNHGGTVMALESLDKYLDGRQWDVIHFNFGLHDLKHMKNPAAREASEDPKDPLWAPPEVYRKNLETIVEKLKKHSKRIIFATTTPVPTDCQWKAYEGPLVPEYNKIAIEIMNKRLIKVNDLYNYTLPHLEKWQESRDVHFNHTGSAMMAKKIKQEIEFELSLDEVMDINKHDLYFWGDGVDAFFERYKVEFRKDLPQVYYCGDSISAGYGPAVRLALKGKVNALHRTEVVRLFPGIKFPDYHGLFFSLTAWTKAVLEYPDYDPRYLVLNAGLHDVHRGTAPDKPLQYEKDLKDIIALMKKHEKTLIWVQTTSKGSGYPQNRMIARFNEISARVMKENKCSVIDLNAYTKKLIEKYGESNIVMPDRVHFTHFGRNKQGEFMAKEIERLVKH